MSTTTSSCWWRSGPTARGKKRHTRHVKLRPGAVLLKYFRDIARTDLNALFPDVRVVMGLKDRLWLGVPALIGGIPILIKIASTVTVLFLVASFYLGMAGTAKDADMAGAVAALSGLVAFGGFIVRQWTKFQRQSLLYQKILSENVYFRNVNNNAGIFDAIVGEAEEQECKEAFLAYYFLLAPAAASRPSPRSMRGSRNGCARRSAPTWISNATTRSASSTGSGC